MGPISHNMTFGVTPSTSLVEWTRHAKLEKFRFVLDFKIKELRRDIAPRETEIHNLRTKTKEMDKELKKYNTINASLGFMVDDLRTRQETM